MRNVYDGYIFFLGPSNALTLIENNSDFAMKLIIGLAKRARMAEGLFEGKINEPAGNSNKKTDHDKT